MNTEKYIDLHTHTTASDGTLTPTEIVIEAKEKNLSAIAVTDHDCVNGVAEAIAAGEKYEVEIISGIELAAYYDAPIKTEIHILGLLIDHENTKLLEKTRDLLEERTRRNVKMTERLTEIGFPMTYEDLISEAGRDSCSRVHYANLMLKKGYVQTKKEAFQRYIGTGKPGYVPRELPTPKECIDLIKESGGIAILAHPTLYAMNYTQIRTMARELKELGLDGIESKYSTYKPEQEREITKIAKEFNLLPSGGSDFHGANKADIFLGIGRGNLRIPYKFIENMKKIRP